MTRGFPRPVKNELAPRGSRLRAAIILVAAGSFMPSPVPAASNGGYLRYRMPQDPLTLDPHRVNDESSLLYVSNLFDGLVEFKPGGTEVIPDLAKSWKISPDGRTYTFKLRDGLKFHDGRAITSADVVFSLRRALDPANPSPLRSSLTMIEGAGALKPGKMGTIPGIQAPDERTVVIHLDHPFGPFLTVLATQEGDVVPRDVYDDPNQGYLRHPVGSGPFMFESWDTGVDLKMKAFKDYWNGPPGVPGIDVRFIPNPATAFEEYKTGGLDYLTEVPPGQRRWARENLKDDYHHWQRLAISGIGVNHQMAPFKGNPTLVRALGFAVDRDHIANVLQEGKDVPARSIIPPGMLGYSNDAAYYRYDPNEAARLLAEAGYPGGKGLPELEYLTPANEDIQRYAESVRTDFAKIGVKVRLKSVDFHAFVDEITGTKDHGPSSPLFHLIFYADYPDPDGYLRQMFHTQSFGATGNFGRYSNVEVDRLLDEGRTEADPATRAATYRKAEALALRDGAFIPIYFYGLEALVRPALQGFHTSPLGNFGVPLELLHFASR